MVNRFERFILTISEIDRYWHKIAAQEMAKYGLKGPYVIYLVELNKHKEGLTPVQLAEASGRNKADVSRAMNDMISKGLVTKINGGNATYRARLMLTDEGLRAAENISVIAEKAVELGSKGLNDEKRAVLYEVLGLITENLKQLSQEGLDEPDAKRH